MMNNSLLDLQRTYANQDSLKSLSEAELQHMSQQSYQSKSRFGNQVSKVTDVQVGGTLNQGSRIPSKVQSLYSGNSQKRSNIIDNLKSESGFSFSK